MVASGVEAAETGTTGIEEEGGMSMTARLFRSEAAHRIGVGTDFHGMSVIVTEIKRPKEEMMTTGGLGKTRTAISTDTGGIHRFGQILGIRQRQTHRPLILLQALCRTNLASNVPITASRALIQTTAGDHLVPMLSSSIEGNQNAATRHQVAQKEIDFLNSRRSLRPPHHRLHKYLRSGLYLTSHQSSPKASQRLQRLARMSPPS